MNVEEALQNLRVKRRNAPDNKRLRENTRDLITELENYSLGTEVVLKGVDEAEIGTKKHKVRLDKGSLVIE